MTSGEDFKSAVNPTDGSYTYLADGTYESIHATSAQHMLRPSTEEKLDTPSPTQARQLLSESTLPPEPPRVVKTTTLTQPQSQSSVADLSLNFSDLSVAGLSQGEGSRREFQASDFSNLEVVKNDNGRSPIKEGILVDSREAVVLKFFRMENVQEITISDQIPTHQNVLQILGTFAVDGGYWTVSLKQDSDVLTWAKNQEHETKESMDVSIQMGRGLNHLHLNDILHRDVALRNFLVSLQGGLKVQICDFEMSRVLVAGWNERIHSFPRSELIPWQHSPVEVLRHYCHSRGSDVYSFGISLWELFRKGEDPFLGRNRAWVLSDLEKHFSAAQLLDLDGIPNKIILLIECCTQYLMHKRPSMTEVVEYLKVSYSPNELPKYFTKVIKGKRSSQCRQYDAMPYEDLNFVEDEARYRDIPLPPAAEKKDNDDDEHLPAFFKRLLDDPTEQQDVDNYVDMCTSVGLYTKHRLKEYLSENGSKYLVDDCFVIKSSQFRILGRALFDDNERESVDFDEKVRAVAQAQEENRMKKLRVRIEGEFLTDREKQLLAGIVRSAAKKLGIEVRVQCYDTGSIIMNLVMTSDNLRLLLDQLNDNESPLRSPGNIFSSATILGTNNFSHGPTSPPDEETEEHGVVEIGPYSDFEFKSSNSSPRIHMPNVEEIQSDEENIPPLEVDLDFQQIKGDESYVPSGVQDSALVLPLQQSDDLITKLEHRHGIGGDKASKMEPMPALTLQNKAKESQSDEEDLPPLEADLDFRPIKGDESYVPSGVQDSALILPLQQSDDLIPKLEQRHEIGGDKASKMEPMPELTLQNKAKEKSRYRDELKIEEKFGGVLLSATRSLDGVEEKTFAGLFRHDSLGGIFTKREFPRVLTDLLEAGIRGSDKHVALQVVYKAESIELVIKFDVFCSYWRIFSFELDLYSNKQRSYAS